MLRAIIHLHLVWRTKHSRSICGTSKTDYHNPNVSASACLIFPLTHTHAHTHTHTHNRHLVHVLPHVIPPSAPCWITPSVFTSCKSSRRPLIGAICNLKVIFAALCVCVCVCVCVLVCVSACNLFPLSAGTVSASTTSVQHRAYTAELSASSAPCSTGMMQSHTHTHTHTHTHIACTHTHIQYMHAYKNTNTCICT